MTNPILSAVHASAGAHALGGSLGSAVAGSANVTPLPLFNGAKAVALRDLLAILQVRQNWTLFAPEPTHSIWHFELRGVSDDGVQQDLVAPDSKKWITSAQGSERHEFLNHRWLKYFSRFEAFSAADWMALGHYLCRQAHTAGASGRQQPSHVVVIAQRHADGIVAANESRDFNCRES